MQWAEITVCTTQEATEAVANLFVELGATGVIIDDPQLVERHRDAGAWDYCDLPVSSETGVRVVGYLPVLPSLEDQLGELKRNIEQTRKFFSDIGPGTVTWRAVQEEDWANGWKKYFHPLRVGTHLVIKPSWESFRAVPQDIVIELDPGMAFGTGTHATTTLCMEMLETYLKPDMSVIDVGTGSGVLAITAAKLGACSVLAVDLDPVAVRVASENIAINKVVAQVDTLQGDLLQHVTQPADMVIANIIANVIIGMATDVVHSLKPHGLFLASGIIDERLAEVEAAIRQVGLAVIEIRQKDGWAAIIARKE